MPFTFGLGAKKEKGSSSSITNASGSRLNVLTGEVSTRGVSGLDTTLDTVSDTENIINLSNFSDEELESINNLIQTLQASQETITSRGTARSNEILNALTNVIPEVFGKFTREQAIKDSRGAVNALVNDILNKGIPGISTSQTLSGGFNDTTTKLLRDNLVVQAAAAGAELQQQAIQQNAELQLGATDRLLATITAIQEGRSTVEIEDISTTIGEEIDRTTKGAVGGEVTEAVETVISGEVGAETLISDTTQKTKTIEEEAFESSEIGRGRTSGSGLSANFGFSTKPPVG